MLFRNTVFVLALAGAAVPAALAASGTTWSGAPGGDHVYSQKNSESAANRADVQKELADALKKSMANDRSTWASADGGVSTPFPQHSYAFRGGKLVHTDSISHDTPKPSRAVPGTEQKLFSEQYGV